MAGRQQALKIHARSMETRAHLKQLHVLNLRQFLSPHLDNITLRLIQLNGVQPKVLPLAGMQTFHIRQIISTLHFVLRLPLDIHQWLQLDLLQETSS